MIACSLEPLSAFKEHSRKVNSNMLVSMALEFFLSELGKGMKCPFKIFGNVKFWFFTCELHGHPQVSCMETSATFFVDLNEMQPPSCRYEVILKKVER